jgi:uncharacterized protein (TIGR03067 family)
MRLALFTLALTGLIVPAARAVDKPADAMAALKGSWKVADSLQAGTGDFLKPFRKGIKPADAVKVDGDKLVFLLGAEVLSEFSVKVDASQSPPTIDLVSGGKTYLGIYELDGDTLRICLVEGKQRPKDVKGTKEGSKSVLALKLQRSK